MGLISKWLGIDARRNAEDEAKRQAAAAEQAQKDALAQQEAVAAQTKAYQQQMLNMQKESASLSSVNSDVASTDVANVVAGGTADAAGAADIKKKLKGSGIASSLGINV